MKQIYPKTKTKEKQNNQNLQFNKAQKTQKQKKSKKKIKTKNGWIEAFKHHPKANPQLPHNIYSIVNKFSENLK